MKGEVGYHPPQGHREALCCCSPSKLIQEDYTCSYQARPKEGALSLWIHYVGLTPLTWSKQKKKIKWKDAFIVD